MTVNLFLSAKPFHMLEAAQHRGSVCVSHQGALGSIHGIPKIFIFDLGVAEIYQRHWFEESGQRHDNLAVTHIGQKLCAKINRYHQFYEGNISSTLDRLYGLYAPTYMHFMTQDVATKVGPTWWGKESYISCYHILGVLSLPKINFSKRHL